MDRGKFYATVRRSFGDLTQPQVDGINNILDEWDRRKLTDIRWEANMLGQTWHETDATMQPGEEAGYLPKAEQMAYLKRKPYYPWYGRGLIDITWEANYEKFKIADPAQATEWPTALRVLFDGMTLGMFTGQSLGEYFNSHVDRAIDARQVVNGMDKASLVATYHWRFLAAIKAGGG